MIVCDHGFRGRTNGTAATSAARTAPAPGHKSRPRVEVGLFRPNKPHLIPRRFRVPGYHFNARHTAAAFHAGNNGLGRFHPLRYLALRQTCSRRCSANAIAEAGVFWVFFMKACKTTIRRPDAVT